MDHPKCDNAPAVVEAMENLKIDSSTEPSKVSSPTKEGSSSDVTSCISPGEAATNIKESVTNQESLGGNQGIQYYGYYYPGTDGSYAGWNGNGYFVGTNGVEMHPVVFQADNGSYVYYLPGLENGYSSYYSPLMSGTLVGADGQYIGQMPYYPNVMLSPTIHSPGYFPQTVAYGSEFAPAYTYDPYVYLDGFQGNAIAGDMRSPHSPKFPTNNFVRSASNDVQKSKLASGRKTALSGLNLSPNPAHSLKSGNKDSAAAVTKDHFPMSKFSMHTTQPNHGKGGVFYPNKSFNPKDIGKTWNGGEKVKTRNKLQLYGDSDLLREKSPTPGSNNLASSVGLPCKKSDDDRMPPHVGVTSDAYNLPDFVTKYVHALFFVIKSYSEDDIHKSIKYNVWSSTPNGNKKLDNAYRVAQEKMTEKGTKCPVFLFFSVNASGQFCGLAEMTGPVDFNKNMDFWQQDKWTGYFPVKWHFIKDVPNPQFRHIILENNENKPVTNSRDTQEVRFPQGTEMLNIFKNYTFKTSILDDFDFYESRQKSIQEKRSKVSTITVDHSMMKNDSKTTTEEEVGNTDTFKVILNHPTEENCPVEMKSG